MSAPIPAEYGRQTPNGVALWLPRQATSDVVNWDRGAVRLMTALNQHAINLAELGNITAAVTLNAGRPYGYAFHVTYNTADGHMHNGPIIDAGYDSARQLADALSVSNRTMYALSDAGVLTFGHVERNTAAWAGVAALTNHTGVWSTPSVWQYALLRDAIANAAVAYNVDTDAAQRAYAVWSTPRRRITHAARQMATDILAPYIAAESDGV